MTARLRLLAELLVAEGPTAVRDRLLDRLEDWKRKRSFARRTADAPWPEVPILNLSPVAPAPRLGGVAHQLLARLQAERTDRPVALLYPDNAGWRLEVDDHEGRWFKTWSEAPLSLVIREVRNLLGCKALHVESPLDLPWSTLLRLPRDGWRFLLSIHDFSLFCRRPHLLEQPGAEFCQYSMDEIRCRRCLSVGGKFFGLSQIQYRLQGARLLAAAEAVVFPSKFLRRQHAELFPEVDCGAWRVISPCRLTRSSVPKLGRVQNRKGWRVAFTGGGQAHKGAAVFERLVQHVNPMERELRWVVYGGGNRPQLRRLRRMSRVRVRGYYRAGTLPRRLVQDRIDLVLLLSVVPESYSLTLSECRTAGVPVLAVGRGALAERVSEHDGMLLSPETELPDLASHLLRYLRSRPPRPPDPPAPETRVDDPSSVVRLYGDLALLF